MPEALGQGEFKRRTANPIPADDNPILLQQITMHILDLDLFPVIAKRMRIPLQDQIIVDENIVRTKRRYLFPVRLHKVGNLLLVKKRRVIEPNRRHHAQVLFHRLLVEKLVRGL
ncbi:MAG: hypothetical protein MJZ42_05210 [Bacteroidales bacterium]|nr:hypothetical protein [Bacteroidales bacterium]